MHTNYFIYVLIILLIFNVLNIFSSNIYNSYHLMLYTIYTNICDPLCEIQAKVSKSNYEKTSVRLWFLPLISNFDMTLLSQY